MDGCGRGLWVQFLFLFGIRWCQASAADQGGLGIVVGMGSVVYDSLSCKRCSQCVCVCVAIGHLGFWFILVLWHYCLLMYPGVNPQRKSFRLFRLRCLCV